MRSVPKLVFLLSLFFALFVPFCGKTAFAAEPGGWKAGVATRVITPTEPLWMAGYASRDRPATEKEHDLFVKALALGDHVMVISGGTVYEIVPA